jgi:hypothetical protein
MNSKLNMFLANIFMCNNMDEFYQHIKIRNAAYDSIYMMFQKAKLNSMS